MSGEGGIKVTDKRMFTPEGEVREEYRELLASVPTSAPDAPAEADAPAVAAPVPTSERSPQPSSPAAPDPAQRAPRLELPDLAPLGPLEGGAPTFMDLVAALAEPASIYLGDITLPDGQVAEHLDMARLHIDLLGVLAEKTAGRLTVQEAEFLNEVLYRLRVRYVQKRG